MSEHNNVSFVFEADAWEGEGDQIGFFFGSVFDDCRCIEWSVHLPAWQLVPRPKYYLEHVWKDGDPKGVTKKTKLVSNNEVDAKGLRVDTQVCKKPLTDNMEGKTRALFFGHFHPLSPKLNDSAA